MSARMPVTALPPSTASIMPSASAARGCAWRAPRASGPAPRWGPRPFGGTQPCAAATARSTSAASADGTSPSRSPVEGLMVSKPRRGALVPAAAETETPGRKPRSGAFGSCPAACRQARRRRPHGTMAARSTERGGRLLEAEGQIFRAGSASPRSPRTGIAPVWRARSRGPASTRQMTLPAYDNRIGPEQTRHVVSFDVSPLSCLLASEVQNRRKAMSTAVESLNTSATSGSRKMTLPPRRYARMRPPNSGREVDAASEVVLITGCLLIRYPRLSLLVASRALMIRILAPRRRRR